jgi:carbon storage regulator
MLILARKPEESVMIGDNIVITVLGVDGDRVKLGIKAPSNVLILRRELYETVKEENLQAAKLSVKPNDELLPSLRQLFKRDE